MWLSLGGLSQQERLQRWLKAPRLTGLLKRDTDLEITEAHSLPFY